MKTAFTSLLLSLVALSSLHAQTAAPTSLLAPVNAPSVVPATRASQDHPVVETAPQSTAILMADGSEVVVRSILRVRASEIRVMTSEGTTGIPWKALHPATQAYLTPQIEDEAATQAAAAAAAESYRASQTLKERQDAELNRTIANRQAADEAQALARAQALRDAADQRAALSKAAFEAETERRALATAQRIEQARVAYQQQLQAQELQIFNALVEVQQIEVLRRLGYLK